MIKSLPNSEQPREKLLNSGKENLSNAELLAIIIRTGTRNVSALDLGVKVLEKCNHQFSDLTDMSVEELCEIDGIGESKACQILASVELSKRLNNKKIERKVKITSPTDVVNTFKNELGHEKVEKFVVVYLNTKNEIINWEIISIGSLNAAIVHPREVFKMAIKKSAAAIIVIHNHPSGNTEPSNEDIEITKRLINSGKLLGIELLDHLIISKACYYSFKEHNII